MKRVNLPINIPLSEIQPCPKCAKPLIELAGTCCTCNFAEDRWRELKIQIQHEIDEMEKGIGLLQCDQEAVFCFLAAYEKMQCLMAVLEEK